MHETEHSKPVHSDNPKGWDREGCERDVQNGGTCIPIADHVNVWQNHYNIVK